MTSKQIKAHSAVPEASTKQHDFILLDASSSMLDKWWDTLTAIDAFVLETRGAIDSHVMLHTFSSSTYGVVEQRNTPIASWTTFREKPVYCDGGMTALYDAINTIGRMLRDINPPRAHVLIVTDGDENASTYTNQTQARAILDWMRAKGWQVTFMGCDFNNSRQAAALGANEHTAIGVQKDKLSDAARALGTKRRAYGTTGSDMHFTDEEKQQFGGYLNPPPSTAGRK